MPDGLIIQHNETCISDETKAKPETTSLEILHYEKHHHDLLSSTFVRAELFGANFNTESDNNDQQY